MLGALQSQFATTQRTMEALKFFRLGLSQVSNVSDPTHPSRGFCNVAPAMSEEEEEQKQRKRYLRLYAADMLLAYLRDATEHGSHSSGWVRARVVRSYGYKT